MLRLVNCSRTYHAETVAIMGAAYDRASQFLSAWIDGEHAKQMLALIILRHVDRGLRDPEQLADVALREWASIERSEEARDHSATG
jgi:hypothetical protein